MNIPLYRQRPLPTPPNYYLPPSKFDTSFLFFRQHRLDEIRDKYKFKLTKEKNKITCSYKQHQADSKLQHLRYQLELKETCWVKSIIVTKYINIYINNEKQCWLPQFSQEKLESTPTFYDFLKISKQRKAKMGGGEGSQYEDSSSQTIIKLYSLLVFLPPTFRPRFYLQQMFFTKLCNTRKEFWGTLKRLYNTFQALTVFISLFSLIPPENIRKSLVFWGVQRETSGIKWVENYEERITRFLYLNCFKRT